MGHRFLFNGCRAVVRSRQDCDRSPIRPLVHRVPLREEKRRSDPGHQRQRYVSDILRRTSLYERHERSQEFHLGGGINFN